MKVRKIFIASIIINILLIGVVYNFIKKDYLNNEKIIVKAMTECEYEEYITSLNQSHMDYANYIEESKTKIASAITDMGVSTSNDATPETMSNNIKSIARDATSISYDNSSSTLTSTNVQGAVDEINNSLDNLLSNDLIIDSGRGLINNLPANGDGYYGVVFNKKFNSPPIVVATTSNVTTAIGTWNYNVISVTAISNEACTINVHNYENTNRNLYVNWIAIGK